MIGTICEIIAGDSLNTLAVIVTSKDNNKFLVMKLHEWNKKINLDSVLLIDPIIKGKRWCVFESIAFVVNSDSIVAVNYKLSEKDLDSIKKKIIPPKLKKELHLEMHRLKSKIFLAELNNESTSQDEKALSEILRKLGYSSSRKQNKKGKYSNFREVPNKGYIKVYRG